LIMKLQILSNCRADNRHLAIGEVAELPHGVADELLALGLAVIAPETEPTPDPAPKPRRNSENGVVFETASAEELAMPPGKVPTKRGRPQFQKED
jgi:hypothetical protein